MQCCKKAYLDMLTILYDDTVAAVVLELMLVSVDDSQGIPGTDGTFELRVIFELESNVERVVVVVHYFSALPIATVSAFGDLGQEAPMTAGNKGVSGAGAVRCTSRMING